MEEGIEQNLTQEEVRMLSSYFGWKPMFNKVIITLNKEESNENSLNFENHFLSQEQYVIAVGTTVHGVEEGDKILLNLEKMLVKEQSSENSYEYVTRVKIEPIEFEGRTFALVEDRVINAVYR